MRHTLSAAFVSHPASYSVSLPHVYHTCFISLFTLMNGLEDASLYEMLSSFSCELDEDIENFLHNRATEFETLSKVTVKVSFSLRISKSLVIAGRNMLYCKSKQIFKVVLWGAKPFCVSVIFENLGGCSGDRTVTIPAYIPTFNEQEAKQAKDCRRSPADNFIQRR